MEISKQFKALMRASSCLLQIVKHKDDYGSVFVWIKDGMTLPYEAAVAEAATELERVMKKEVGEVMLECELDFYTRRLITLAEGNPN